jgi:hypothetical protein
MNWPGIPGQNSIGRKAHSVVAVDETIGQNIRRAASTSMPTARIIPNMVMLLTLIPSAAISPNDSRNEQGMAMPTSRAERRPRAANTTIITRITAVRTLDSSWLTMSVTRDDSSIDRSTLTAWRSGSGQPRTTLATAARAASTVSMMFSPIRFLIWSEIDLSPLNRARPVASSKVRRISVTSPRRTTRSPLTLTGRLLMSSSVSNEPGTVTEKAAVALSTEPAAISWLLRSKTPSKSCAVTL